MRYDIIVIGAGPAGYVAAQRGAQLGRKVALVEASALGGVCLNWGCIPTKALLKSAQVYRYACSAEHYGVKVDGVVSADLQAMVSRSRDVAQTMSKGIDFMMKKHGVEMFMGHGRLCSTGSVEVVGDDGARVVIEADHIILATGARPRALPSLPVDGVNVINSRQALVLGKLPRSIVVVGSGAIGCEFATLYAQLGSQVTLVEYMPQVMPLEDGEVSKTMERLFRKMKMTVMTSTEVKGVEFVAGGCRVAVDGKRGASTIEAEVVLSAVGIKSNIENLGLEELGVAIERDKIVVDQRYMTNIEGIYAVGDIIATPALAHTASAEATRCVEWICGIKSVGIDYSTMPSCIYTVPEVASVGVTEQQAVQMGIELKIGQFQFLASGRAAAAGQRDGFVKLIFDATTDRLIGAHFVGDNVTEMISEAALAKMLGATCEQIVATVHPHPTMSEAVYEAAVGANTPH